MLECRAIPENRPLFNKAYIQIMGRTGNAGIIGTNQHFKIEPDGIMGLIEYGGQKRLHILLNIRVILIGGYDAVGAHHLSLIIVGVVMEEYAAGHLDNAHPPPGAGYGRLRIV